MLTSDGRCHTSYDNPASYANLKLCFYRMSYLPNGYWSPTAVSAGKVSIICFLDLAGSRKVIGESRELVQNKSSFLQDTHRSS